MPALTESARLHIRCDQDVRNLLAKAVSYAHMSVSEFVLKNAVQQAKEVFQAHESITLSKTAFATFLDALDNPLQLNPALRQAFQRHAQLVVK